MKGLVINLQERKDRLEAFQLQQFPNSWDIAVFPAYKESPGWNGCLKSHLSASKLLYNEGPFVIMEDDCQFVENWIDKFQQVVMELPADWDVLYLGINAQAKFQPYSKHLARVTKGLCNHAYLINNPNVVEALLEITRIQSIMKPIDVLYMNYIQSCFNCYCTIPQLAYQAPGKSDIVFSHRDYRRLLDNNFKKFVTNE